MVSGLVWLQEQIPKEVFKEIGLRAPNIITILGSIVNIFGGTYMTSLRAQESYTVMMNKIFRWALKILMKVARASIWIC